jgi:hypothetical protein
MIRTRPTLGLFFHVDDGERFAVYQWDGDGFHGYIAFCSKEFCSRQRRSHLVALEPGGSCSVFAGLEDQAADSAARPIGMDKEGSNLCRIAKRVEQRILAACPMIAAVKCLAFAPAAASDDPLS